MEFRYFPVVSGLARRVFCGAHAATGSSRIKWSQVIRMAHQVAEGVSPKVTVVKPPSCKGMTVLDKEAFRVTIKVPVVHIAGTTTNRKSRQNIFKSLKPYLLKKRGLKPYQADGESRDFVFINPDAVEGGADEKTVAELLDKLKTENEGFDYDKVTVEDRELTYDNWSPEEILDSVLPDEHDKTSGFSKVGHLIHLNLRDHLLPFKNLIGQVLLEKIPNTTVVVNKVNEIDTQFRFFKMEVLAGEDNTLVDVNHGGCSFRFDFANVYWNPRLDTEHSRICQILKSDDTLYDVFAGVGPFAIPAAKKKKVRVLANDLNPESYKWLQHNLEKNKCSALVKAFNLDGRDFIHTVAKEDLKANYGRYSTFHFVMNLPALAVDFLDAFWNVLEGIELEGRSETKTRIHVYCFIKDPPGAKYKEGAKELVKQKLGYDLSDSFIDEVFIVRRVAPNKEMMRVSFRLPAEVALGTGLKYDVDTNGVEEKRPRLDV